MSTACPSLEVLAAFLEHALPPEQQASLEHHLVECRKCREILKESLSASEESSGESARDIG